MRLILRWTVPGGVAVAAALALLLLDGEGSGEVAARVSATSYAMLVYGLALALAVVFHRSRVFAALLPIALLDAAHRAAAEGGEGTLAGLLSAAAGHEGLLSALAPGMVAFLGIAAVARDRRATSLRGALQAAGAVACVVLLVLAAGRGPAGPGGAPTGTLASGAEAPGALALLLGGFSSALAALGAPVAMPPLPVALTLAGLLLSSLAAWRRRGPAERAIPWAQAAILIAAWPGWTPAEGSVLVMASSLALGLGVIETSYAMAYRDELTDLPGRRSLVRDLEGLGGTYALAMVDVDHFKRFNDRHGHEIGDQVLRLVASRLARAPGGARAYRYGGEEFTLLFRGRGAAEAEPHLEAVRAAVAEAGFTLRGWNRPRRKPSSPSGARRGAKDGGGTGRAAPRPQQTRRLSVTVSIGVADSSDGSSPEEVLERADEALYRAKRAGRNRVSG